MAPNDVKQPIPKRHVTELFIAATLMFFVSVVGLSWISVLSELMFADGDGKGAHKVASHLVSLHNITGTCVSVMILAVLLPVGLPASVADMFAVRLPRQEKRQSVVGVLLSRVIVPMLDVNNDKQLQWFELWTGLSLWAYAASLASALAFFLYSRAPAVYFIQLGGGMARLVTTILVKGYFKSDEAPKEKEKEGEQKASSSWLSWLDVNHDGRLTKIDVFCALIVLVFALLQISNTVRCVWSPRDLLEQINALPLLVVTLAALACFAASPANVGLFQATALVYLLLIALFVANLATGKGADEVGSALDCLLRVGGGMSAAVMQLVATFLSRAVSDKKSN